MSWIGSVCDEEGARRTAGSVLTGQNVVGVLAASLSTYQAAQAAAIAISPTLNVADTIFVRPVVRGYHVASNYGATFASSYATLYASLPTSTGHQRYMFAG